VNAGNLIGANRCADTAAADRYTTIDLAGHDRLRERNDDIWIVVNWVQTVSAKIEYLMSRRSELGNHFFLQTKSTVIGSDSYSHIRFMVSIYSFCRLF
jgi:hypothetical protein